MSNKSRGKRGAGTKETEEGWSPYFPSSLLATLPGVLTAFRAHGASAQASTTPEWCVFREMPLRRLQTRLGPDLLCPLGPFLHAQEPPALPTLLSPTSLLLSDPLSVLRVRPAASFSPRVLAHLGIFSFQFFSTDAGPDACVS